MGFLYDAKLDNMDDIYDRIANSDDPNECFFLRVENSARNDKGGYEVYVGKPGSIDRLIEKGSAPLD